MKNIAGLMKQAAQMQKKMEEMQVTLESTRMRAWPAPAWSPSRSAARAR